MATFTIPGLVGSGPWSIDMSGNTYSPDKLFATWKRIQVIRDLPPPTSLSIGQAVEGLHAMDGQTWDWHAPRYSDWWELSDYGAQVAGALPDARWDIWPNYDKGEFKLDAGVFNDGLQRAWLMVKPWRSGVKSKEAVSFPPLKGLAGCAMTWDPPVWYAEPVWYFHALNDASSAWKAMVRMVGRLGTDTLVKCDTSLLMTCVNQASRHARGTLFGGRPFVGALPFIEPVSDVGANIPDFSTVALMTVEPTSTVATRSRLTLDRLLLGADALNRTVQVYFDWSAPWRDRNPVKSPAPSISVTGRITNAHAPEQFALPPFALTSTAFMTSGNIAFQYWMKACSGILGMPLDQNPQSPPCGFTRLMGEAPAPLLHFGLDITSVSSNDWIRLGSLEIRPVAKPNAQLGASLEIRVHGQWTEQHALLYPWSVLSNVRCCFRFAAGSDAGSGGTVVGDDNANESTPIVDINHQVEWEGRLTIETRIVPGGDAWTRVTIDEAVAPPAPVDQQAFWLNLKPFLVAQVGLTDLDDGSESAGGSAARKLVWSTDDPQWRLTGWQIKLTLPPQAVGEDMDRGDRFYGPNNASKLDTRAPVRYRFSPPTQLTLQPASPGAAQRYEPSPMNVRALIRGVDVKKLVVEMVYPLTIDYERSSNPRQCLRLTEAMEFFGALAPQLQGANVDWPISFREPFKAYFAAASKPLIASQRAAEYNYVSRLAELCIHDPSRNRDDVQLDHEVTFRIRGAHEDAPPANPLPDGSDLLPEDKAKLTTFLQAGDWSADTETIRGGVLHTIEFASELNEVLADRTATSGTVESLRLSAVGATGRMHACFANGKTEFHCEVAHGQIARLVKIRIGRVAGLWNRARHVVVYERSCARSVQFAAQQTDATSVGWPILRKTEEYVEPIEVERIFANERNALSNNTAFIDACVFATRRIYVDSAWGRDLGHGYEIPLWNEAAASHTGDSNPPPSPATSAKPFHYPKPQIHLRCFSGPGNTSKQWFEDPQHLFFYSSTTPDTTADTDAWPAIAAVDFSNSPQFGVFEKRDPAAGPLSSGPSADSELCTHPRFDLRVDGDGPVDLQHGRGTTPMLSEPARLTISRSAHSAPSVDPAVANVQEVKDALCAAALATQARTDAEGIAGTLEQLRSRLLDIIRHQAGNDCTAIGTSLRQEIDAAIQTLRGNLLSNFGQARVLLSRDGGAWKAAIVQVVDGMTNAALQPVSSLTDTASDLKARIAHEQTLAQHAASTLTGLQTDVRSYVTALEEGVDIELVQAGTQFSVFCTTISNALDTLSRALTQSPVNLNTVETQLLIVVNAIDRLPARQQAMVAPLASCLRFALDQIQVLQSPVSELGALGSQVLTTLAQSWSQPAKDLQTLIKGSTNSQTPTNGILTWVQNALISEATASQTEARKLTTKVAALVNGLGNPGSDAFPGVLRDLIACFTPGVPACLAVAYTELISEARTQITKGLDTLCSDLAHSSDAVIDSIQTYLNTLADQVRQGLYSVVDMALGDCSVLGKQLQQTLDQLGGWAKTQSDRLLGNLLSNEASRCFEAIASVGGNVWDAGSQALQLARCVGSLPSVAPLRFDIHTAAYAYNAASKLIAMSPTVARLLGDGEAALESLGLAVPHSGLNDLLALDNFDGVHFAQIFPRIGGLDCSRLFPDFKLEGLTSQNISIKHGYDTPTRRAWVNSTVHFVHPDRESVFCVDPIDLYIENAQFDAQSGIEATLQPNQTVVSTARTRASIRADWCLAAAGQTMVRFNEVTLTYDGGSGFDFHIDPKKIEYHPALQFITDFLNRFSDALPSGVQVDVVDGRPVGVSASMTNIVTLPDMGAVSIGPIDIRTRLGLRFEGGKFVIDASCAIGRREVPIFIQISFLGGGAWLTAQTSYSDGSIHKSISIGLSLGSTRTVNFAGIAKGTYSFLLFCEIDVDENDTSISAGISVIGAARILGFVNAGVSLLLEAHYGGGQMDGTGTLDVSVTISWCFTFRFKQSVRHRF